MESVDKKAIKAVFKPFLWSYDVDKMDFERDKTRIITNVLNLGTKEATDLLFKIYDKEDIKDKIIDPMPGEWNKKSLNYWSLVFGIENKRETKREPSNVL